MAVGGVHAEKEREWTNLEGRSFRGQWVGEDGAERLRIRHEDGRMFTVERSQLSDGDAVYVAERLERGERRGSGEGMRPIPGGIFQMGDAQGQLNVAMPVHPVVVDAFYLGEHLVTYAEWRAVVEWATAPERGAARYRFDHEGRSGGGRGAGARMPVTCINWYDALKWCNARSEKEGREPVYYEDRDHREVYRTGRRDLLPEQVRWAANGYRLPTEAEWERAARGGREGEPFVWGSEDPHPGRANYWNSAPENGTTEVGLFPANPYGLFDLAGNVWEWTWTRWGSFDGRAWRNPMGVAHASHRVTRGGSWSNPAHDLQVAYRRVTHPTNSYPRIGLRVAQSAENWGNEGWNEPFGEEKEQGKRVDGR